MSRFLSLGPLLAVALVTASCSGDAAVTTTPVPSSTTVSSSVTAPAPTTTTTEPPPLEVVITGDLPDALAGEVSSLYGHLADDRNPPGASPAGFVAHLSASQIPYSPLRRASHIAADLASGASVAVVHVGEDLLFAVDHGDGWRIIGGAVGDASPWLFDEPAMLLVIGSDARPGQSQPRFRADSIHILALSPTQNAGTIVGFPRDTYISADVIAAANETVGLPAEDLPAAGIKWTNLMAGRGPDIMLETAKELTGLPVSGYVLAGFVGFDALITELGGLEITLSTDLETGNNWDPFPSGEQLLNPTRALQLARIRKALPGGDFARSLNQGLIVLAAMTMAQERGIDALPGLVSILAEHAYTDLNAAELMAFAAAGMLMSPDGLGNVVLTGDVETIDDRSVVLLHESEKEQLLADLADDGIVDP